MRFYHCVLPQNDTEMCQSYSELHGMLLHSLLTEKHMVFPGTGEVLNTISELIIILETSIM